MIAIQPGIRIRFRNHMNEIKEDTLRAVFQEHNTVGHNFPAAVLTEHSWIPLSWITEILYEYENQNK
jgi:hypothetical protein